MANLIIKSSADNLVLQGSDASPAITVGATGTTTFAENATLSGTANNLGTVTAGSIAGGSITSATTFPAGHIVQVLQYSNSYLLQTQSSSELDFEQSSGVVWEPSITVTSGNKVLIQTSIIIRIGYSGGSDARASMRLYEKKGAGSYANIDGSFETMGGYDYGGSGLWLKDRQYINYLSSPNTGDLIKYKITLQANNASAYMTRNESTGNDVSTMILMEVTT